MDYRLTAAIKDDYFANWQEWADLETPLIDGQYEIEIGGLGPIDLYPFTGSDECGWIKTTEGQVILLSEVVTHASRYDHRVGQKYELTVEGGIIVKAILVRAKNA